MNSDFQFAILNQGRDSVVAAGVSPAVEPWCLARRIIARTIFKTLINFSDVHPCQRFFRAAGRAPSTAGGTPAATLAFGGIH